MAENPLTPPTPSLTHFNLEFEDRVKISQLLLGWRDGVGGGCGKKKERERERCSRPPPRGDTGTETTPSSPAKSVSGGKGSELSDELREGGHT